MPIPRIKIVFAVSVINMFLQTIKSTVFVRSPSIITYQLFILLVQMFANFEPDSLSSHRRLYWINSSNYLRHFGSCIIRKKAVIKTKGSYGSVKQCFSLFKFEKQSRWLLRSLMRSNSEKFRPKQELVNVSGIPGWLIRAGRTLWIRWHSAGQVWRLSCHY